MTRRELILSILLAMNMACLLYVGSQDGPIGGDSNPSVLLAAGGTASLLM